MIHNYNPSIQEAEAGGLPRVPGQPRLQCETLSQNQQTNKQTNSEGQACAIDSCNPIIQEAKAGEFQVEAAWATQ